MYDIRFNPSKYPIQAPQRRRIRARLFAYRNYFDIITSNSLPEFREVIDAYDCMPETVYRQPIDQINETIFQSAHVKAEDNVGDEGGLSVIHSGLIFRRQARNYLE